MIEFGEWANCASSPSQQFFNQILLRLRGSVRWLKRVGLSTNEGKAWNQRNWNYVWPPPKWSKKSSSQPSSSSSLPSSPHLNPSTHHINHLSHSHSLFYTSTPPRLIIPFLLQDTYRSRQSQNSSQRSLLTTNHIYPTIHPNLITNTVFNLRPNSPSSQHPFPFATFALSFKIQR